MKHHLEPKGGARSNQSELLLESETTVELPHIINLVIGDWSKDGHNQTETVTISSNLSKKDVEKAFLNGLKKLGFEPGERHHRCYLPIAEDYEDNSLDESVATVLEANGLNVSELTEDSGLWTDGYLKIWFFVTKLGNPDFEYEIVDGADINIGGYGLFQ